MNYSKLTKPSLIELCKTNKIKNYSGKKKDDLIDLLKNLSLETKTDDKKELGQYYTTNYNYILQIFTIPELNCVVEPFVGIGNLIEFITSQKLDISKIIFECYDIVSTLPDTMIKKFNINFTQKNTLLEPPNYNNKFLITNPPFLAKNKTNNPENNHLFQKYNVDDLCKCLI
jgi:hypothetical protein